MPFHAKASWGGSKGLSQALPETGTYFTFSQGAFRRCDILSLPWKTSENVREITLHVILLIPVICWFDIIRRVSTGDLWPRGAQPASQHNAGGAAQSGASAGLGCGCRKLERCVEQVGPWELQSEWEEGADRRLFGRLFFLVGFFVVVRPPPSQLGNTEQDASFGVCVKGEKGADKEQAPASGRKGVGTLGNMGEEM